MRTGRVVLVAAVLLALAGCTPGSPHSSGSPSASARPVFASDAEALAAAEAAYAKYLKVSDAIAQDGGRDAKRFSSVVTSRWLTTEIESAGQLQESGWHQVGFTVHSTLALQRYDSSERSLIAYTCLDLSGTRIVDSAGADVTPPDRSDVLPVVVGFRSSKSDSRFLIDSNEPWSDSSIC